MFSRKINPTAIAFIGFCTVIGVLSGNIYIGLAIGLGLYIISNLDNSK